ncbi:hypothetical protein BST61_g10458 [Cercospora zeina]
MHFLAAAAVMTTAVSAMPAPVETRQLNYADRCVFHHNIHRSNHSAPMLTWDADLAAAASTVAESCKYEHNIEPGGGGYGQNIAAGVPANNVSAVITDMWYNSEVTKYPAFGRNPTEAEMEGFSVWGHFTQLVWKNSTLLGCATSDCSTRGGLQNTGGGVMPYFTVCNYKTVGNYAGQYADQVGSPLGQPTVDSSA